MKDDGKTCVHSRANTFESVGPTCPRDPVHWFRDISLRFYLEIDTLWPCLGWEWVPVQYSGDVAGKYFSPNKKKVLEKCDSGEWKCEVCAKVSSLTHDTQWS